MNTKKVILLILDGWGEAKPDKYNAIDNARTPVMDTLRAEYPNLLLKADGENVGLPKGQMGTSEVNHMAIGTGRIRLQDLPMIDAWITAGSFDRLEKIQHFAQHAQAHQSNIHLIGIVSDGGIHSHTAHLEAILKACKHHAPDRPVYIHVFTDGRDTPPKSAQTYLQQLDQIIERVGVGTIATLQGRVYLDRDRDWEKTERAFQLIRNHQGKQMPSWQEALAESYLQFDNDQYHTQYWFDSAAQLSNNDAVFFFNFRTDRNYQLIKRTLDEQIPFLNVLSFVSPSEAFAIEELITRGEVSNTLAQVLAQHQKNQYHLTETEKYPHVTFFFNGEKEQEYPNEQWQLLESDRFVKPLYNFEPSMRAFDITKLILQKIEEGKTDFMVINFATTDMVGHTGNYEAALVGAEAVDYCLGKIYAALKGKLEEYCLVVTADHGNSDEMWDYINNQPHTQHTLNPVPFVVVTEPKLELISRDQLLSNIAPTVLDLMGLPKPNEMTGASLVKPS